MDQMYPGWNPTKTSYVHVITANPTVNISDGHHITTGWERLPTLMPDGMVPVYVKDMPTTTANAAGGLPRVGVSGVGAGSLGMLTVMIMLYNLLSGLGFGFMLWKGVIDWKGNVNVRIADNIDATFTDAASVDAVSIAAAPVEDAPFDDAPFDETSADDTSSDSSSIAEIRSTLRELNTISRQIINERINGYNAEFYANDAVMQQLLRQLAEIDAERRIAVPPS